MKTFTFYGLTAILLVGLTTSVFAQSNMDAARQQMHNGIMKQELLHDMLVGYKTNIDLTQSLGMSYFREGFGLSQEQIEEIQRKVLVSPYAALENDPDFMLLRDGIRKFNPDDPEATEETLKNYADFRVKLEAMRREKHVSLFYENLTPEQAKKVHEFHIATMSETEYVFPRMFEALDLSDEQRKQFDAIQKEMRPEFEKHVDKIREYWGRPPSEKDAVRVSGKELADKLKIRMFDVLTDAQWARLQELVDNPPDHAKKWLAQQRTNREHARKHDAWVPGPGAWQPGSSAIPEQYRQERNRRFPRGGN